MENFIDEFISYFNAAGPVKIIRLFWFFFLLEFTRYYIVDLITLLIWRLKLVLNRNKWNTARQKLYEENPLVSIIVPGKNEGKHLYKLTKSLAEQTYRNYELIIVDDGSDDQTPIIGRSLEQAGLIDLFIRNDVRGGKASGANTAMRYAKGSIIVHLDADCSYDYDAIEKVILPFYYNENIGAVGGNVLVRNYKQSLCTTLQGIEYAHSISVGRIVVSELGIYRIVSGAFGAFKRDALERVGGWDIGPGLDGDITVKFRKMGYSIFFQPLAVCLTSVPDTFQKLRKQRLRWDKSLIRFRLRKHSDVFLPTKNFRMSNFIGFAENITYNLLLNIKWFLYVADMLINYSNILWFIFPMNLLLYTTSNVTKYFMFLMFRIRKNEDRGYFIPYLPLLVFYFGYFIRWTRTQAYIKEFFYKESYDDAWNPPKTSVHAKALGL
jgi:cellulose synthase/poly-beta-1,6-N-acetylglucosamine synthase-like glycosyltransferase